MDAEVSHRNHRGGRRRSARSARASSDRAEESGAGQARHGQQLHVLDRGSGSKNGVYGYHSLLEDSPWLAIDLGRPFAIRKIKVFGRGDGYYDQSIPLALEASDDGTNYQQFALRSETFSEYDPWVVEPSALVTRYLRLRTMRHSCLVLGEVEVNGSVPK